MCLCVRTATDSLSQTNCIHISSITLLCPFGKNGRVKGRDQYREAADERKMSKEIEIMGMGEKTEIKKEL